MAKGRVFMDSALLSWWVIAGYFVIDAGLGKIYKNVAQDPFGSVPYFVYLA